MKKKYYQPELGQAVFGQPPQDYECPEYIEALLSHIGREIERVEWNKTQQEFDSPFSNTGAKWSNDTFSVHAYSWDDSKEQTWNFKYKDIRISWYKYLGRGMSINKQLTEKQAIEMFDECMESVRAMDIDIFEIADKKS